MSKDWNQAYANNKTPWDKGAASPALEEWLGKGGNALMGKGLVLGCGLGHDVRLLAKSAKSAKEGNRGNGAEKNFEVIGIDFSQIAIEKAEALRSSSLESYLCYDFFKYAEQPDQSNSCDWAFEHTFFCAIPKELRKTYVDCLVQLLKPKAFFLAIFFIEDPKASAASASSDGPPFKIKKEAIDAYFEEHFNLIDAYTPKRHYKSRPYGSEYVCLMQLK